MICGFKFWQFWATLSDFRLFVFCWRDYLPAPKKPIFELRKEFAPSFAVAEQIVGPERLLRTLQLDWSGEVEWIRAARSTKTLCACLAMNLAEHIDQLQYVFLTAIGEPETNVLSMPKISSVV